MRLSGLSNQHKTLKGLLEWFPENHERNCEQFTVPTMGRLLRYLLLVDGPDLWVGSSMSLLNFNARDTMHQSDDVPSLAYADAAGAYYRIRYPVPRELNMPEDAMISFWEERIDKAAARLLQAFELSDCNPNRITANWFWYVCPKCNYHHPHYHPNCVRCHHLFPEQRACHLNGVYRRLEIPSGAIAPNHPKDRSGGSVAS